MQLGNQTFVLAGGVPLIRGASDVCLWNAAKSSMPREGEHMLVAFSVSPMGGDSDSVGAAVAAAVRVVRESGLSNETTSMFTTIEGEWDEVMAVVKRATDVLLEQFPRVSLVLKADIRPGRSDQLRAKVETVERYLAD